MNTKECCNHNCNQGRDCPRRSLAEEITEGFDALKRIRQLEEEIAELKNARDYWCLQYKDVIKKLEHTSYELDTRSYLIGKYDTDRKEQKK